MQIDQLVLYDQAMITWVTNTLPPLIKDKTTQILISTPRRSYAEVTTGRLVDERTFKLPRIAVTRLQHSTDSTRFNSNNIRRLGWTNSRYQAAIRNGKFPAPIIIPYQLDFWSIYVNEMNLWEQKVLFDFAPSYTYQTIRPDDVWGDKQYAVFLDGPIVDNSDLEPGEEGQREIRKTVTLNAHGWIFDQDLTDVKVIKRLRVDFVDPDTSELYDREFLPPEEILFAADGTTTSFGPITLTRPPILKHTIVIQALILGITEVTYDDGSGHLASTHCTGTIDYVTGSVSLTYTHAPDNHTNIVTTYFTDLGI
jgi:hypothetical protein